MRRTLLRFQVAIASAAVGVILLVGGGAAVVQSIDNNRAEQAQEVSDKEAHFWRIVAGEGSGSSPTVDVLLARDLQGLSASQVDDFRGHSNRYGGITDAIGFDPFDETGLDCFECGPLDQGTKDNLALIRADNLDAVINKTTVEAPKEGLTLTPFGLGIPTTVFILWMVGGPLTLAAAHYTAKYNGHLNRWAVEPTAADERAAELRLTLLAPSFWLPHKIYMAVTRQRFEDKMREMFPDHVLFLENLDRTLERLPDTPSKDDVRMLRNEVMLELETQTRGYGDTKDLDILMAELGDVQSHLQARQQALRELEGQ